jgi:hypothetical protein
VAKHKNKQNTNNKPIDHFISYDKKQDMYKKICVSKKNHHQQQQRQQAEKLPLNIKNIKKLTPFMFFFSFHSDFNFFFGSFCFDKFTKKADQKFWSF